MVGREDGGMGKGRIKITHTTICLRPRRGLRMNLRVRRVTGVSASAILIVFVVSTCRNSEISRIDGWIGGQETKEGRRSLAGGGRVARIRDSKSTL